jgi:hypothetical protein
MTVKNNVVVNRRSGRMNDLLKVTGLVVLMFIFAIIPVSGQNTTLNENENISLNITHMVSINNTMGLFDGFLQFNLSGTLPFGKLVSMMVKEMVLEHEVKIKTKLIGIELTRGNVTTGIKLIQNESKEMQEKLKELKEERKELIQRKKMGEVDKIQFILEMRRIQLEAKAMHTESLKMEEEMEDTFPEEHLEDKGINTTAILILREEARNLSGDIVSEIARSIGINVSKEAIKKLEIEKERNKTEVEIEITNDTHKVSIEIEKEGDNTVKKEITVERKAEEISMEHEEADLELEVNDATLGNTVIIKLRNSGNVAVELKNAAPFIIKDEEGVDIFTPIAIQVITVVQPGETITWKWDQKDNQGNQVVPGEYKVVVFTSAGTLEESFEIFPNALPTKNMEKIVSIKHMSEE